MQHYLPILRVAACLNFGLATAAQQSDPFGHPSKGVGGGPVTVRRLKSLTRRSLDAYLYPEALKTAQLSSALAPNDTETMALLALIYLRSGDSLSSTKITVRLSPEDRKRYGVDRATKAFGLLEEADALLERGYTANTQVPFAQAAAYLEQAIALDDIDILHHRTLGWLYLEKLH